MVGSRFIGILASPLFMVEYLHPQAYSQKNDVVYGCENALNKADRYATPVAPVVVGKLVCRAASCMPVGPDPSGLSALLRLVGSPGKANFANFSDGMRAMLKNCIKKYKLL